MIYIIGDSFSEDPQGKHRTNYIDRYIEYKGRDVKFYPNLLSEHFKQPITNLSIGGTCNETILVEFMKIYPLLKPNDLIVLGWTSVTRFSTVSIKNKWSTNLHEDGPLSKQTLDEVKVMRTHDLFKKRLLDIIDFIDVVIPKDVTIIHWTWSFGNPWTSPYTIKSETNGEIDDSHYSELGHLDLFNKMIKELETTNRVRINLQLSHIL
jgi:hypothetical protein